VLERPFAPFLENLTLGIIPAEWDKTGEKNENLPPPGTGPFKLLEFSGGSKIVLEKFADSFTGSPKLNRLEFRVIKDDSVRMLELLRGSIDLVQNAVNPDLIPQLKASPDIRVETKRGTTYKYLGFNITDPILKNLPVRQAIAHAINRDAIIDGVLHGMAVKASGLLTSDNWAYKRDVREYEYNPLKAMQLLDEAGYLDPDGPGPESRFKLIYKTSQNKRANRVAEVIRGDLLRIGIDVEILRYEWPTFYSDIKKGNFQMFSLSWVGVKEPDIYYYIFHSSSFPNGGNRGRYKNPEVDKLLETARFVLDQETRRKAYAKVQKIIAEECPYVSMWHETNIVAMRNRVQGYRLYPRGNFWSLPEVFIDPGKQ
jgi:peptide/nickel transport system substrate-binding protein